MSEAGKGRPWHLWVVGILAVLWNAIGVFSFVAAQTMYEPVMSQYTEEQVEYFENLPTWTIGFWAIGVFGGVIGSLLLLARAKLAVGVLMASLIGAFVSNAYGLFFANGMEVMGGAPSLVVPAIILVFAALLVMYARKMCK